MEGQPSAMKSPLYRAIAFMLVPLLAVEPALPAFSSPLPPGHIGIKFSAAPFQEQALQEYLLSSPRLERMFKHMQSFWVNIRKMEKTQTDYLRQKVWDYDAISSSVNNQAEILDLNKFITDDNLGQGIPVQLVVKAAEAGESTMRRRWLQGYKSGGFRMHRARLAKMGFAGTAVVGQEMKKIEDPNAVWRRQFHDPKGIAVNERLTVVAGSETLVTVLFVSRSNHVLAMIPLTDGGAPVNNVE